jgi:hypothetical protein
VLMMFITRNCYRLHGCLLVFCVPDVVVDLLD